MKKPKTSLIITTYNWPQALMATLNSLLKQTELPDDVVIADDGSTSETAEQIKTFQKIAPFPVKHVWQEDQGFRAARSRNRGIAASNPAHPYVIIIDGDLILHPNFIRDHKRNAEPHTFIQGTRVITAESQKDTLCQASEFKFHLFSPAIKNRKNTIHSDTLSSLANKKTSQLRGIRSCNMSFWREDLLKVNGFNDEFEGWGREDSELAARLFNNGLQRKNVRFNCLTAHIYHHERQRDSLPKNDQLLQQTIDEKIKSCSQGLKDHLEQEQA